MDNEKLIKQIQADYRLAIEHPDWVKIREQAELDDRALSIAGPWSEEDREERKTDGRPCVHLDLLSQYANALVNEARSISIGIKADPAGGKANEKTAKLRENRIRSIEYESNATQARMSAFESMVRHGFGAYGIDIEYKSWDDFRKVIRYREFLNSYSCLWDPGSIKRDWSDIRFWFDLYSMSKKDYEEEYGDSVVAADFGKDYMDAGWQNDGNIQVARYWWIDKKKTTMMRMYSSDFPGKTFKVFKDQIAHLIKLPDGSLVNLSGYRITDKAIILKDGTQWRIVEQRDTMQPVIKHCLTNGKEILEQPEEWPGRWIPRFPMVGKQHFERHGNKIQRVVESYIRKGRDGNMLYDFYASKEAEDISMVGVGPYRAAIGQISQNKDEWADAHRKPAGVIEYDPTPDSVPEGVVLQPPSREIWLPSTQITEIGKESARRATQAAIGSYGVTRLDDTNVKSGIAMERLKQQNDMGSYHFMDALKTMIKFDGEVVNDLLDNVETDAMEVGMVDMAGNRSVKMINSSETVNPEDPDTYRLTDEDQHEITLSVGRMYESQRIEDAEVADQLVANIGQILPIVGPDVAKQILAMSLKKRDLGPDFDELIKVLSPQKEGEEPDPKAIAAELQKWQQLATQLGEKVQALEEENKMKLVEIRSKERMNAQDNLVDLTKAEMSANNQAKSEQAAFVRQIVLQEIAKEGQQQATAEEEIQAEPETPQALEELPLEETQNEEM